MQPRSAARNGSHANSAICFRSKCRTRREVERQPEASACPTSDRRGTAASRCPRSSAARECSDIDGRRPSPCRCFSCPAAMYVALLRAERRMPVGRLIQQQPQHDPDQPEAPVMTNAACQLYARIAHATSGGASIEPTDAPMLNTPPARPRSFAGNHSAVAFMPAGLADPSANPSSAAQPRQRLPAVRQPVRHVDQRPRDREDREPRLQPEHVEHVPADRLQHDRALERADDPRVLFVVDMELVLRWSARRPRACCA